MTEKSNKKKAQVMIRRVVLWTLHLSLVLILVGAAMSHFCSKEYELHLRLPDYELTLDSPYDGNTTPEELAGIRLREFIIDYYPGTSTPMNFTSVLSESGREIRLSMNKAAKVRGYKLVQSQFDSDSRGIVLKCTSAGPGAFIFYLGFILLGFSFLAYMCEKNSLFRVAIRKISKPVTLMVIGLLFCFGNISARDIAPGQQDEFMQLLVLHNDRVTTLSTLAIDFTSAVTGGKRGIKGMDADDVFRTFLFDFGSIKGERMIKVSDNELRKTLGIDGKYASYEDYMHAIRSGRLDIDDAETVRRWNEDIARFETINMLVSGELMKIFPHRDGEAVRWFSPTDAMLRDTEIDSGRWIFMRKALGYLNEAVLSGDTLAAGEVIRGISTYQGKESGVNIPANRVRLEQFYMRNAAAIPTMIVCLGIGLLVFVVAASGNKLHLWLRWLAPCIAILCFLWLGALITMRWVVSGHVPLANGFETMQFMTLVLLLFASVIGWKSEMLTGTCMFAAGLSLAVAAMSGPSQSVMNLMPVLASPLLSIHVVLVMMAYSLFIILMLNGLAGLITKEREKSERLMWMGRVMLYPAVILLAAGICVGAVWADVSWGNYWSWDPKQTWALITMLVYGLAFHRAPFRKLNQPKYFHLYMTIAFLSVLITYFGVNFYLGGHHSYA